MSLEEGNNYYTTPISVTDAASMLRTQIPKNIRPYQQSVLLANNRKVDTWKKEVLDKIADPEGNILAGKVWDSWLLFSEGKETEKYISVRDEHGIIIRPGKDVLSFWVDFFEQLSIEEMCEYGKGVISMGWSIVETEIRCWTLDEKWDKIYSLGETPVEWEAIYFNEIDLVKGDKFPFWDKEMYVSFKDKVNTILNVRVAKNGFVLDEDKGISPKDASRLLTSKIPKNEKHYIQAVMRYNNNLVKSWERNLDSEKLPAAKMWKTWYLYSDMTELSKFMDMLEKGLFIRPSEEVIEKWKNFFDNTELEELQEYERPLIAIGWGVIESHIRIWTAEQKWNRVYSKTSGVDLKELEVKYEENIELFQGKVLPFWSVEKINEIKEKILTILQITVQPVH